MKVLAALLLPLLVAAPALAGERVGDKSGDKDLLIVYAFVSKFDKGKLGTKTRECVRGHALRSKKLTTFDQISEEELLEASPLEVTPKTKLEKIGDHARKTFGARYAIWGEVTRAKKGYALHMLGAHVEKEKKEGTPGARLLIDETYKCANVHFIPQHAETFIAGLLKKTRRRLERKFGTVVKVLEEIGINGDFSKKKGSEDWPAGWHLVRPNLKPQVSWAEHPGGKKGDRCVAYDMNKKTAANEGIMLAGEYIKVKKGSYYQASVEILSKKPKVIFWVRGYTEMKGEKRETYRFQIRFYPEKKGKVFERLTTEAFKPRHPWAEIQYIRLMIYAYHPAGKVYFDNAWLKRVEVTGDERPDPAFVKEGGGEKLK